MRRRRALPALAVQSVGQRHDDEEHREERPARHRLLERCRQPVAFGRRLPQERVPLGLGRRRGRRRLRRSRHEVGGACGGIVVRRHLRLRLAGDRRPSVRGGGVSEGARTLRGHLRRDERLGGDRRARGRERLEHDRRLWCGARPRGQTSLLPDALRGQELARRRGLLGGRGLQGRGRRQLLELRRRPAHEHRERLELRARPLQLGAGLLQLRPHRLQLPAQLHLPADELVLDHAHAEERQPRLEEPAIGRVERR